MITLEQGRQRQREIIERDLYHPWYDRTIEVARFGYKMMTGHDQDEYITHPRKGEQDDQKKQRVRLYNSLTPIASNQTLAMFRKVRRTDEVRRIVEHEDNDSESRLSTALQTYYAGNSLDEYLFDEFEYLTFYDPNAYILTEQEVVREGVSVVDVRVFPTVIHSQQVREAVYSKGLLEALFVESVREEEHNGEMVVLSDFYTYAGPFTIHYHEIPIDAVAPEMPGYDLVMIETDAGERAFMYREYAYEGRLCPAEPIGVYADPVTNGKTYITPLHYAEHTFKDLIRDKSNHDVNKTLHHFPQKYVYAPMCTYEDHEKGLRCENGFLYLGPDQKAETCPACKGTGAKVHASNQDVITIAYDETAPEQMQDLSKFAFYVNLPEWLPRWMADDIKETLKRVQVAIFTTEVFDPAQLAKTATEVTLTWEQVYDTLTPYAQRISASFKKHTQLAAYYLEVLDGLTVEHSFPADFKMRTDAELANLYTTYQSAGVSSEILWAVEADILRRQYKNNPQYAAKVLAFRQFMPFRDKTPEMVTQILSRRDDLDPDRVLWENWTKVTDMALDRFPDFHLMPYEAQKAVIYEIVEEVSQEIVYVSAPAPIDFITEMEDEQEEEVVEAVDDEGQVADFGKLKEKLDAYGVAVRAGALTPQQSDEESIRQELGLPNMSQQARQSWVDSAGVRKPVTIKETVKDEQDTPKDSNDVE